MPADAPASPIWQPDAALASLWLIRRLGGQRVTGTTSFVPHTLIHTLDAMLAECWLDEAAQTEPPAALAWQLTAALHRQRSPCGCRTHNRHDALGARSDTAC